MWIQNFLRVRNIHRIAIYLTRARTTTVHRRTQTSSIQESIHGQTTQSSPSGVPRCRTQQCSHGVMYRREPAIQALSPTRPRRVPRPKWLVPGLVDSNKTQRTKTGYKPSSLQSFTLGWRKSTLLLVRYTFLPCTSPQGQLRSNILSVKYLWASLKGPSITPAINFHCSGNRPLRWPSHRALKKDILADMTYLIEATQRVNITTTSSYVLT